MPAFDWLVSVLSVSGGLLGWFLSSPSSSKSSDTTKRLGRRIAYVTTLAVLGLSIALKVKRDLMPMAHTLVSPGSLTDQTILVTGGTTGLGLESVKSFALGGATVVFTSRTKEKGDRTVNIVQDFLRESEQTNDKVYAVQLDLDDLDNVKSFPDRLAQSVSSIDKIDVLLNNAGIMAIPDRQLTKDGYERTFQSNHLGHFVLTAKLWSKYITKSKQPRVINVSSLGYMFAWGGLDFENINSEKSFGRWQSYGYSKLENIYFTKELQKRVNNNTKSQNLVTIAVHPGSVLTDLARHLTGERTTVESIKSQFMNVFEKYILKQLMRTPAQGAATQVYVSTANVDDLKKAQFYADMRPEKVSAFAEDMEAAAELWEVSEKLGGVTFDV